MSLRRNAVRLYLQGHLEAEEYAHKKHELSTQEAALQLETEQDSRGQQPVDETMQNVAHYMSNGLSLFRRAETESRRFIAKQLGCYWFNNGELEIELNKIFDPVRSNFKKPEKHYLRIEPPKAGISNLLAMRNAPEFTRWRTTFIKYRTFILENNLTFPRLDLPDI